MIERTTLPIEEETVRTIGEEEYTSAVVPPRKSILREKLDCRLEGKIPRTSGGNLHVPPTPNLKRKTRTIRPRLTS